MNATTDIKAEAELTPFGVIRDHALKAYQGDEGNAELDRLKREGRCLNADCQCFIWDDLSGWGITDADGNVSAEALEQKIKGFEEAQICESCLCQYVVWGIDSIYPFSSED